MTVWKGLIKLEDLSCMYLKEYEKEKDKKMFKKYSFPVSPRIKDWADSMLK